MRKADLISGVEQVSRALAESGLPRARVEGERGRTVGQLKLFANLLREGSWNDVRIDKALPDRALSVTFDDGYLDNLTTALPVLKLHGISAALFVPTGGLDDDQPLWWDRVIHALASTSHTEFAPADLGLPLSEQRLSLRVWHRRATVERVLDSLWTLPIEQVLAVVSRIERHFGERQLILQRMGQRRAGNR